MRPLGRSLKLGSRFEIGRRTANEEALRQRIFAVASSGKVDLDSLCDRVLADMPEPWTVFREDGCSGEVSA
jgi:hypothetical protein